VLSHQRHFSRGKNKNNTDQLQEIRLLQTEIHVLGISYSEKNNSYRGRRYSYDKVPQEDMY